jgi:hypothetical protein
MDTSDENRDIDIDDVAVAQWPVIWDTVTNDLSHRGTDGLREAAVVERARVPTPAYACGVRNGVELVSANARRHRGTRGAQDLSGHSAGLTHRRYEERVTY